MPPRSSSQTRFIAAASAGRLARWLRLAGFDTAYHPRLPDGLLIARALKDRRVILTRSRRILDRRALPPVLVLKSEKPFEQLRQVVGEMNLTLDSRAFFSRCCFCNLVLETASRGEVREIVPPYVFKTRKEFRRCGGCRRIFWAGTHQASILRRLETLLSAEGKA